MGSRRYNKETQWRAKVKDLRDDLYGKYNGNETSYVLKCLDSEDIENKKNPWVGRLEKAFAKKFSTQEWDVDAFLSLLVNSEVISAARKAEILKS